MTSQTSTAFGRSRDDAWFRPQRRTGRIGAVGLGRLLAFAIVELAVCAIVFQSWWAAVVGGLIGVAAAAFLFGRRGGRWWTEILALRLRFRRRRGIVAARRDDPRLAALCELAPDFTAEDVAGADDSKLGMGSDGAGWFAVLEVTAEDGPLPPVPMAALARIANEQPGVVVQSVLHSAPLPGTVRRDHVVWIAVRLDARAVASSAVDSGVDPNVPVLLADSAQRVERLFRRRGLRARALDTDGLLDALVRSCDLSEPADRRPVQPREEWDSWRSTRLRHGCFWMRSWPNPERGSLLLSALAEVPEAQVSISIAVEAGLRGTELSGLVRVAADAQHYDKTCEQVARLVELAGGRLSKLDGQQLPAVYASAPTGGGAR
ncbi:type VII secretion protein EccE [Saccharopolyspora antimicrobica]|uniref:Type VII secretion protein EccE n=1 Tax=Saccharopolyspora antimicrobica TaxID=455193 RepID=A0A1I5G642_9PSEU|nr:type VII secretion protein EccE [Saccharopolyspora antimicrobica]RKT83906.1 type VII secretion protein EccE [Saccharopolyspora antimicrobica]SFO31508.1 type VII secretion protein EccE [Saccharopolyspora antimicrobica]